MTILHSTYLQMTDDPETIADDSRMLAPRIAGFIGDDEGQYLLIVESNIVTQTSSFNPFMGGAHLYMSRPLGGGFS